MPRCIPAVRYVHEDGRVQFIEHGTEGRARRNVAIVGRGYCTFAWVEKPTLWEQIKCIGKPREYAE